MDDRYGKWLAKTGKQAENDGETMALNFFHGKRILITGHTGFKGSWLTLLLLKAGAEVTGYALEPPTEPSLFRLCNIEREIHSVRGDVRDLEHLRKSFEEAKPELVIHLAAQPIVRESYKNPVGTYETNVMGTVNLMECIRQTSSVRSVLNVTTDKVYENKEWHWGYRENEGLNGFDPYSNSKSCSELVTDSFRKSFFAERDIAVSTARAGNVIGGGDFARDRIIPDCVRSVLAGKEILVRNPQSLRPYQHVLEPLLAYLLILEKQDADKSLAGAYNIGPDEKDCRTTGEIVTLFCEEWKKQTGKEAAWRDESDGGPHEANLLKLDCSKIKSVLGWRPRLGTEGAMEKIVEWTKVYQEHGDIRNCMEKQIQSYEEQI